MDRKKNLLKLYGKVYDLTDFKHPGGDKFIEKASQTVDATPLFESHHFESEKIKEQILSKYEVKGESSEQIFSEKSWTEGFYPECKAEVYKWLQENPKIVEREKLRYRVGIYLLLFIYNISIFTILFSNAPFLTPLNLFLCFITGWIKPLLVGIAHNFMHKDRFQSFLFGLGFMDLSEWETEHVFSHHPYTNTKYDIDFQNIQKLFDYPKPIRMLLLWVKLIPGNIIQRLFLGFTLSRKEYFLNWFIPFVEVSLFFYMGKRLEFFLVSLIGLCYFLIINFSNHYIKPIHYADEPVGKHLFNSYIKKKFSFHFHFQKFLLLITLFQHFHR